MKQLSLWDFLGLRNDAFGMSAASENAFQASHDAKSPEGHEAAASAHKDAMAKAAKKGDTHVAEMHARMAQMHAGKASEDDADGDE